MSDEAVSTGRVLGAMEGAGNGLNLVILDACRNNPYSRGFRGRSARGLAAPAQAARGSLIAYATSPNAVAADGSGRNGLYTKHLLRHMQEPGLGVEEVFKKVRIAVERESGGQQTPWELSSLTGDFSFTVASTAGSGDSGDAERRRLEAERQRVAAERQRLAAERQLLEEQRRLAEERRQIEERQSEAEERAQREAEAERLKREQEARERAQREAEARERLEAEERAQREAEERARRQAEAEAERRRREREPARRFRDCDACPEMVVVPAGSFMMGSPPGEAERDDDEGPVHRVTIAEPFAVGIFEVTFREWDACVSGGGCNGYHPDDGGWGRGNRPVIYVSWDDAQAYVKWLSRQTGHRYRLLSESEWEYVARAGTTGPFHTGATISTKQANYNGNPYGSGRQGVYRGRPMPVGSFAANAFGLHDAHGNVQEWTEDCWNGSYRGAPDDGRAWERGDCSWRMVRDGYWGSKPRYLRAANRGSDLTAIRYSSALGFRIARTLSP